MNKPNYYLSFEIYGCAFNLMVNNIPIFQSRKKKGVSFKYPINSYIFTGRNELGVTLTPPFEQQFLSDEAKCKISIIFIDEEDIERKPTEVLSHTSPVFEAASPNSIYLFKNPFPVEVPFPNPLWMKSVNLADIPQIKYALLEEYLKIHKLMNNKDVNGILNLILIRQNEVAKCLYIEGKEIQENLSDGLVKDLNDSHFRLCEIDGRLFEIKFYAYGKLTRLEGDKGESPLKFRDEENKLTATYDFLFCMNPETNKLVIIR